MDSARQIRFVIAPFFFYCSLLLGAMISDHITLTALMTLSKDVLIGVGAVLVASTMPLGFLFGSFSILLLRFCFRLFSLQSYEIYLSENTHDKIWSLLGLSGKHSHKDSLYAGVTFDHEIISSGVHEWLVRRWSAFNISIHSITALLFAHFAGFLINIPQSVKWWSISVAIVIILSINAIFAWRHTMNMIDFQSRRLIERQLLNKV